ncbi:hypothetical protein ACFSHQ_27820 [Gemmobacter lanyuensis]
MKIALPRRIRFSRFLNMPHARWTRLPLGMMWLFTLLATAEPVLAREMARRIIRQDQFHRAARRASFYARRSWMRLHLSRDMIYVFCNQMTLPELAALRRFLNGAPRRIRRGWWPAIWPMSRGWRCWKRPQPTPPRKPRPAGRAGAVPPGCRPRAGGDPPDPGRSARPARGKGPRRLCP